MVLRRTARSSRRSTELILNVRLEQGDLEFELSRRLSQSAENLPSGDPV
jgi:hypothetical protein